MNLYELINPALDLTATALTLILLVLTAVVSVLVVIGTGVLFLVGVKWLLKMTE